MDYSHHLLSRCSTLIICLIFSTILEAGGFYCVPAYDLQIYPDIENHTCLLSNQFTYPLESISLNKDTIQPEILIELAPIYFGDDELVLNRQAIEILDSISILMQNYPNLDIGLLSHGADYTGPKYLDLYFSMRRAEQAMFYLASKGIGPERIQITSFGSQFPYISKSHSNHEVSVSKSLNRRIELCFYNSEAYNLKLKMKDPGIKPDRISIPYKTCQRKMQGITYKIELIRTATVFNDVILDQYEYPSMVRNGLREEYSYTLGWSENFQEIQRLYLRLISAGFKGIILAYKDGVRVKEGDIEIHPGY